MPETILVTGANGQLGSELRELAPAYTGYHFVFLNRQQLPIDDVSKAEELIEHYQPKWFINCAAYTAVDKAESEREEAENINGAAVAALAQACRKSGTGFLHISTDYVFNGHSDRPWKEDDRVDPVNAYGASKLAGEIAAMKEDPQCIIIRTSWVYSSYGKNFVKTMLRLMKEREVIGVVADQVGAPTYAADLAEAIMKIIASGKWVPGIYHFSNRAHISWYEFAMAIKEISGSACRVEGISTEQYPTPAKRPQYSVLDLTKIAAVYGIEIKGWRERLELCLQKLSETT
jgi:dTDP-4-dehydrorhamnose reductase